MKFIVYVIKNTVGKIYIGQTSNLEQRLKSHNGLLENKKSSFTHKQKQGEWLVVYTEEFLTRREAMQREKQLKSAKGREYIKSLIK